MRLHVHPADLDLIRAALSYCGGQRIFDAPECDDLLDRLPERLETLVLGAEEALDLYDRRIDAQTGGL